MLLAVVATVALAVAGCASTGGAGGMPPEAVGQLEELLRKDYPRWYAGIVVDEAAGVVTVYRKTGSDLDGVARGRFPGVELRFADARLSEQEMLALSDQVIADIGYWRSVGVPVTGAGPLPDGSAVRVMTSDGAAGQAERMSAHYRQPIVVELGSAVLAPFSMGPDGLPTGPTGN